MSSSSSSMSQSYSATTSYSTSTNTAVSFTSASDIKKAFRRFDTNGDGELDKAEMKQLFSASGKNVTDQDIDAIFKKGDLDGDGMIDIQEFVKLMFPSSATALAKLQKFFPSINDAKS